MQLPPIHKNRGVTYSRPTTGTGMPLQERFGARPIWACLVACPVHEITSFVVDSSRSRKSVFQLFKSHTSFSGHPRIEGTGQVIMQAAIFAHFSSRPVQRLHSQRRNRSHTPGAWEPSHQTGAKRRVTLAGPCPSCRLRKAGQASCQPRACFASMGSQSLRAVARSRAR